MNHKKQALLFLLIGFFSSAWAQTFIVKDHYVKREVYIPMRDGTRLFTAIYLPKDSSKTYPILMNRTPYGIYPYGADTFPEHLRPSDRFAEEGFIFVVQDVRGRMMSEGIFVNMTPHITKKNNSQDIDESSDTYDCIEWLLKNISYHNGKVGLSGSSYPGFYTSAGMINAHPALKACSPQAPICDWFTGDDFHHNGALFVPHFFGFMYGFGQTRNGPGMAQWKSIKFPTPDGYQFFLDLGGMKNVNSYYRHEVPFWDEMTKHETYDDFWKKRNLRPHLKDIKPAVLIVGGWFDAENLYGALNTFRSITTQSPATSCSIIMGPWFHGGWYRASGEYLGDINFGKLNSRFFRDSVEFPFFNYHLKGIGNGRMPAAIMFETGSNTWKRYDQWPPGNTREVTYYLQPGGKLGSEPQVNTFEEFISDPGKPVPYMIFCETGMTREYMDADQRFAATRPDVIVYQSDPFVQDQNYPGPVRVQLNVSTSSTDADWIVKVIDVYPDDAPMDTVNGRPVRMAGYQMMVRGEVMRGKFRNSFEKPEPFIPGKMTEVNFVINDINHTFRKGHRLMIQVQSTWFPLVDRNPQQFMNIFEADKKDFLKATHRIYGGSNITFQQITE